MDEADSDVDKQLDYNEFANMIRRAQQAVKVDLKEKI
jgi:hypothetical protein